MQDQAKKLAEEHWSYVGEVVKQGAGNLVYLTQEQIIDIIKFHYQSAFIHGFKHGVENMWKEPQVDTALFHLE